MGQAFRGKSRHTVTLPPWGGCPRLKERRNGLAPVAISGPSSLMTLKARISLARGGFLSSVCVALAAGRRPLAPWSAGRLHSYGVYRFL